MDSADFAFNGFTSLNGWDTYASRNQDDRTTAPLARQGMTPPEHLSRALYIPRHDRRASQITLYDISAQYTTATGGLPIGSSEYVVALGLLQTPGSESSNGASVSYDVTFRRQGEDVVGSVRFQGATVEQSAEVELYVQYNAPRSGYSRITATNDFAEPLQVLKTRHGRISE